MKTTTPLLILASTTFLALAGCSDSGLTTNNTLPAGNSGTGATSLSTGNTGVGTPGTGAFGNGTGTGVGTGGLGTVGNDAGPR